MSGLVLGTNRGVFRADASGAPIREVGGAETGPVQIVQPLDDGGWLVGAYLGTFRLDGKTHKIESLSGADTGSVSEIVRATDGSWLVGSDRGLFRVDANGRSAAGLVKKQSRLLDLTRLGGAGWLARTDGGLVHVDQDARKADAIDDAVGIHLKVHGADEKSASPAATVRMEVPAASGPGATPTERTSCRAVSSCTRMRFDGPTSPSASAAVACTAS